MIAATLPFEWGALEIEVACIDLPGVTGGVAARTFGDLITSLR